MHASKTLAWGSTLVSSVTMRPRAGIAGVLGEQTGGKRGGHVPGIRGIPAHDARATVLDLKASPSLWIDDQEGRSSSHPFIARIPLTFALLLPLLIALLLGLLLGVAPLSVGALFLIYLPLVWRGLVDLWPARTRRRGRWYI